MTNLHVLLKRLILSSIGVMIAAAVYDYIFFESLPAELQTYNLRLAEQNPDAVLVTFVAMPAGLLNLLSLIFLWKLKRIGRTMFTVTWIISLIAGAGMMPLVFSSFAQMCVNLYILIDGLILGLVYFSDLRFEFEREAQENN